MRIKALIFLSLFFCTVSVDAQETQSLLSSSFQSGTLKRNVEYKVYLPEGYPDSQAKYPVIYLLHGYGDSPNGWITYGKMDNITDEMIRNQSICPMILVMPDAQKSWYINGVEDNYEDFFINEFIPYIESTYKCNNSKTTRAIAGISMGGYGALLYSLKHPDLFSVCCALSPAVLTNMEIEYMSPELYSMFHEAFGERNSALWKANGILEILNKFEIAPEKSPAFYIECGDSDFLYRGNAHLHISMSDKKIEHHMIMRHGAHNWDYWIPALSEMMLFISSNVKD